MPAEATSSPFHGPVLPTAGSWERHEVGHTSRPPPPLCVHPFSGPCRIPERSCVLRSVPTCLVGDTGVMPPKPARASRTGSGSRLGEEKRSGQAVSSGHPCRQGAGGSDCEAPQLRGGSGGALAMWKQRGSSSPPLPAAIQEHRRQHRPPPAEHRPGEAHGETCKKAGGGTPPSEKSFWMSVLRVPSPRQRLAGFRREESPGGRRCCGRSRGDSQQRREVVLVSKPGS